MYTFIFWLANEDIIEINAAYSTIISLKFMFSIIKKDLLDDLPVIKAGEGADRFLNYRTETTEYLKSHTLRNGIDILTQHIARPHREQDKEIYKIAVQKWEKKQERLNYNDLPERLKTHQNRTSFFDRFKVVASDLPYAQTVVAHIAKDGHYYIHQSALDCSHLLKYLISH